MEQRQPATHIWITELTSGNFIQQDDAPSAVVLQGKTIQRARLYGTVVSTNELVIDDGTGSVPIRTFDKTFDAQIGDTVLVIGMPRVYEQQLYILGEIVKKVDSKWLELRERQHPKRIDQRAQVIEAVKNLDTGNGADYNEVTSKLGRNAEELIVHLLAIGELFETRPGKLKVLE